MNGRCADGADRLTELLHTRLTIPALGQHCVLDVELTRPDDGTKVKAYASFYSSQVKDPA